MPSKFSWEFDSNSTYIIAGGLGGLGRSTAAWMADRGAKNLILISRSGPVSKQARALLARLESQGVVVYAPKCDLASPEALSTVLSDSASKMPPIKGCIQCAMVLQVSEFFQAC